MKTRAPERFRSSFLRKTPVRIICAKGTGIAVPEDMQLRTHSPNPRGAGPQWPNDLPARIQAEYSEMPGLRLTIPQAARLWNVDQQRCEQVLDLLAEDGFLFRLRDTYVRRDSWQTRR